LELLRLGKFSIPEENGVNLPTRKRIKKGEQYSTVPQNNFIKKKNPAKLIFGRVFGRKLN